MRQFMCAAAGVVVLTLTTGCGGGSQQATAGYEAKVSGTITLDGKPLDMGMVFFEKDGKSGSSTISEGGKLLDDGGVPSGKVKVKVDASMYAYLSGRVKQPKGGANRMGGGGPGGPPGEYREIPKKYRDFATSGLEFDLKPGANDLGEIKLTSK